LAALLDFEHLAARSAPADRLSETIAKGKTSGMRRFGLRVHEGEQALGQL